MTNDQFDQWLVELRTLAETLNNAWHKAHPDRTEVTPFTVSELRLMAAQLSRERAAYISK